MLVSRLIEAIFVEGLSLAVSRTILNMPWLYLPIPNFLKLKAIG